MVSDGNTMRKCVSTVHLKTDICGLFGFNRGGTFSFYRWSIWWGQICTVHLSIQDKKSILLFIFSTWWEIL